MSKRTLHLQAETEVGLWLAAMEDARERTLVLLRGGMPDGDRIEVPDDVVDRGTPNSVGAILYHLAAIEADWLLDDICGTPDDLPSSRFPWDVRERDGVLTPVTGSLDEHLDRMTSVRRMFHERMAVIDADAFHEVNERASHHVSPVWVVHHLLQHEAEHRAEIGRALQA